MTGQWKRDVIVALVVAAITGPTSFLVGRLTSSIGEVLNEWDAERVAEAFMDDDVLRGRLREVLQRSHREMLEKMPDELNENGGHLPGTVKDLKGRTKYLSTKGNRSEFVGPVHILAKGPDAHKLMLSADNERGRDIHATNLDGTEDGQVLVRHFVKE